MNHHMGARNQTLVFCNSHKCSQPLSHFSSPWFSAFKVGHFIQTTVFFFLVCLAINPDFDEIFLKVFIISCHCSEGMGERSGFFFVFSLTSGIDSSLVASAPVSFNLIYQLLDSVFRMQFSLVLSEFVVPFSQTALETKQIIC